MPQGFASFIAVAFLSMVPETGFTLRPYATTDADVVDPGVIEIELGIAYGENKIEGATERIVGIPWVFNVGLPGLNGESDDFGVTCGLTYAWGAKQ